MATVTEYLNPAYSPLKKKVLKEIQAWGKVNVRTYFGGWAYRVAFDNGYEISIIKHDGSYGHDNDNWEIAVMKDDTPVYNTPITNDVVGWLYDEEVLDYAMRVRDLPRDASMLEQRHL